MIDEMPYLLASLMGGLGEETLKMPLVLWLQGFVVVL